MKLKLSYRRPSGSTVDLVITADSTATVADVARSIADSDPYADHNSIPADAPLTLAVAPPTSTSPVALPADALIAEAEIGSGFVARVRQVATSRRDDSIVAVLRVEDGPDAGREFAISAGHSIIGRGTADGVAVSLTDPLVSKRHARLEVGRSIELIDLNSANGIVVDGGRVPRAQLGAGQRAVLGDTTVCVTRVGGAPEPEDRILERGGTVMFNRSPRVEVRYPGRIHKHPVIPTEVSPPLFPWSMIIAPVMLGFAMFAFTGRALALLMVAMTPMMMVGNQINQRRQNGQKLSQEIETFDTQIERLEDDLTEQVGVEQRVRRAEAPAVATVYEDAMKLGRGLWTRRPEHWNFLAVRLGIGRSRTRNSIQEREETTGIPEYARQVEVLRDRFAIIDGVPIMETLPLAGAIGVAGPREEAADVVRGLAVQLFGLHAPNELVTAAIVDPSWTPELEWMKWLPHTSSPRSPFRDLALADSPSAGLAILNGLEEAIIVSDIETASRRGPLAGDGGSMSLGARVGERSEDRNGVDGDVALLLVVSHDAPVDRPRLTQVIERGPDAAIFTIFVGPTVESLPAACRAFVDVSRGLDDATVSVVREGIEYTGVAAEGVSNAYAEVFAKRLAPVVDSASVDEDSSDIPRTVNLLSLVGTALAQAPDAVIERWRQNNSIVDRSGVPLPRLRRAGTLKAFVGQGSPDAFTLDLRTQGPHALVGGTTGSGKSEFLQAWVLGMAAEYSPDRVTFLFVDYKGGSAFADCVELPHCVGLVTDLSPHLVRRALTSLRAELHFREHLFNRKKAKDLLELEKRRDPETPPALVLVIDEFAALAGEVPEFVDGVVDIAQRGRSLGIHLIMATQRPAGVIKDNLRANTNLRVALRMADESDSKDVVGDPIAGTFDPSIPGRGIAKTGPGRLIPFQSAYAGGWTDEEEVSAEVRIAELRFGSVLTWEAEKEPEGDAHDADLGPNDQKRMVRTFIAASRDAGIPAPRRPWLDDLASVVDIRDLASGGDSEIPLGIMDIPARQAQERTSFVPDRDGAMLIYGTSGSGKSTALRSIALAAGLRPDLGETHVYGLDFGSGALRSVESLPHVSSVVSGDDSERVERVLRIVGEALDRRGDAFADASAATLSEYRELTGQSLPRILVLLDGFGAFKADWEGSPTRVPFYNLFLRILGEGRPLGVHAVITADRSGAVPMSVSANISRRIVLRMSDDQAYAQLGVAKDILDERSAPGRAIVDGLEVQLAVPGGVSNVAEQTRVLESIADDLRRAGAPEAAPVGALPALYRAEELPDSVSGEPVLGLADDTLAAAGFEPVGTFSVVGPPRSGKTSALRAIVRSLVRFDPGVKLFHLAGRRAMLTDYAPWVRSATSLDQVQELAKELAEIVADESVPGRIAVVVENVPQFADSDAERPLKQLFQAINRSDHLLIGDADVNAVGSGFGFIGDFKAGRRGIALRPDAYDGESVYKTPFPRVKRSDFGEGRGFLVQNGRIALMQMPLVDDAPLDPMAGVVGSPPHREGRPVANTVASDDRPHARTRETAPPM